MNELSSKYLHKSVDVSGGARYLHERTVLTQHVCKENTEATAIDFELGPVLDSSSIRLFGRLVRDVVVSIEERQCLGRGGNIPNTIDDLAALNTRER